MRFFILHTRTQVPFPSLLPNTLTLGLSIVQVTLPSSVPFSRGCSLLPLLFFGELFDSLHINAFCSLFISDRALGRIPRVRSLGISPRVRFPGKNSLERTRSLSLRQLTRKRFGTKRIIRLLPALNISYKIYQFSQCHKQDNSDKCVNNHNSKY